jgi:hypothetical protein
MDKVIELKELLKILAGAARSLETIEIYYPKTEHSREGWREVEPYSIATDIGEEGEHLIYGKEYITPGHIFNAYTIGSKDNYYHSFILGKIKKIRRTGKKFVPRNNWKVEF